MTLERRRFLAEAAGLLAGGVVGFPAWGAAEPSADAPQLAVEPAKAPEKVVVTDAVDGAALQSVLFREAGNDCCVRIDRPRDLTCLVREDLVGGEKSIHALLVPEGTKLQFHRAKNSPQSCLPSLIDSRTGR